MHKNSAVSQVVGLKRGRAFSRSRYIPHMESDPEKIQRARQSLVSNLTPVVARARAHSDRNYRIHTMTTFTRNYDIVVTGVIVVEEEEEDEI